MYFVTRGIKFLRIGDHQTHVVIHLIYILVCILSEFVLDNVKVNGAFNDSSIIGDLFNDFFDGVKER